MIHFKILIEQETEEAKAAYEHGLILIYDASEADLESRVFEHDLYLRRLCEEKLRKHYFQEGEDPDEDEEEHFEFWLDSMVFYRYTGKSVPKTVAQALKRIQGKTFWPPQFICLAGTMHDTHHFPAKDQNGHIIGVRF